VATAINTILLDELHDLAVDYPTAPEMLGNFIARCVADCAIDQAIVNEWCKNAAQKHLTNEHMYVYCFEHL
jgi:hypothetical protein